MSDYRSTTERAADLRAELKETHGYTGRDVSVRKSSGSIRCTIKRRGIKIADVREIASKQSSIHRDESGTILRGGNVFVEVVLDDALVDQPAAMVLPWVDALEVSGDRIPRLFDEAIDGLGVEFLGVQVEANGFYHLWIDGKHDQQGNSASVARAVAMLFVQADVEVPTHGSCGMVARYHPGEQRADESDEEYAEAVERASAPVEQRAGRLPRLEGEAEPVTVVDMRPLDPRPGAESSSIAAGGSIESAARRIERISALFAEMDDPRLMRVGVQLSHVAQDLSSAAHHLGHRD